MTKSNRLSRYFCSFMYPILFFTLGACSTININEPLATNLQEIGRPRVLLMQTQIIHSADTYSMDLIVDISRGKLTIIGSSLGIRVFTLSYDGVNISEGLGKGLPFYISNSLVVDDVMLALTSHEALKANLPIDCSLVVDNGLEKIYCRDQLIASVSQNRGLDKNMTVSVKRSNPEYELNIVMSEEQ